MRTVFLLSFISLICLQLTIAQKATVREEFLEMKTYPFSDPNPVPEIGRIYPYFDYSGYTSKAETMRWKMVVLENEYVKVYVCPDIGGKVWGAIEKSTGHEFLYFNHVVKFRDVAMRGPWTSGGLEFNFGDIGHIPTCSTPVDYVMKENPDGSVSCVVGAIDLPSETKWNVEITVYPDRAYFETAVRWFNNTSLPCTYYHWMNAAAKSAGNLEFIYPGTNYIGHDGEPGDWPVENGREISYYENNNFGTYKSYHVLNAYTDFFGGYYHDDNFGFGHLSDYDEKPGKKLWIWGLSQQGMIWEGLLTDDDGQYIEFQAGKLFNQAAEGSTYTPFKHKEFPAHDSDIMHEIYFPLKQTGGMVAASREGVLNLEKTGDETRIIFSALQPVEDILLVEYGNEIIHETVISLKPLEKVESRFLPGEREFKIYLKNGELKYSSKAGNRELERPLKALEKFNWESAYGLYTKAYELEKQRMYDEALIYYQRAIKEDPGLLPALTRIGMELFRRMEYNEALGYVLNALSINTYDPEANYLYGLINDKLDKPEESKSGFSIAAASVSHRSASYTELARIFTGENSFNKAIKYADKALVFNNYNPVAMQIKAVSLRKLNLREKAEDELDRIFQMDPTNHVVRSEKMFSNAGRESENQFKDLIKNELPYESYIDLALFYHSINCNEEAIKILKMSPDYPVVHIWLAGLDSENQEEHVNAVISSSPELVFPYRNETAEILEALLEKYDHWKLKYYLGLIYWNRNLDDNALSLFVSCGDDPDYAPFYMTLAELSPTKQNKGNYLKKAYELEENDWRAGLALSKNLIEDGKADQALGIVKGLLNKNPEQSAIGLTYARALMTLEDYEGTVDFLESYNVLPFEGATIGRDLYHEACIRVAFIALGMKHYKDLVKYAEKALSWPVNLGVGKPYNVDERLENYFLSLGYDKLKQHSKAREYLTKVANHPNDDFTKESPRLIFQLLALGSIGHADEDDRLFDKIKMKYPENQYLDWIYQVLTSGGNYSRTVEKANDNTFEFKLISDFFRNQ